jgi:16S rRNA (guanine(966)-N(2))-methyltransferase RsmD
MRIAGGKYQGRIFAPNKKFSARPTTDLAKEGLFNILENRYDFSGKTALDLFSGTGSIGYEFISRGCSETILVEKDFNHFRFIGEVLNTLNIKNARVFRTDVFRYLLHCRERFDFVFADPPFDFPFFAEVPVAVFKAGVIKEDGLFILEHPKEFNFSGHPNFKEIRKYGKVNFSFFEV